MKGGRGENTVMMLQVDMYEWRVRLVNVKTENSRCSAGQVNFGFISSFDPQVTWFEQPQGVETVCWLVGRWWLEEMVYLKLHCGL